MINKTVCVCVNFPVGAGISSCFPENPFIWKRHIRKCESKQRPVIVNLNVDPSCRSVGLLPVPWESRRRSKTDSSKASDTQEGVSLFIMPPRRRTHSHTCCSRGVRLKGKVSLLQSGSWFLLCCLFWYLDPFPVCIISTLLQQWFENGSYGANL